MKIHTAGIVELRGKRPEIDGYGHPTGATFQDSAVISRKVVRVDELCAWLREQRQARLATQIERLAIEAQ